MSEIDFWNRNKRHVVYEYIRESGGSQANSTFQETSSEEGKTTSKIWNRERFPIIYEGNEAKAVLVDVISFAQIELILDNLFNREAEAEDAVLAASGILEQLLTDAQQELPSSDWEKELNEL